MKPTSTGNLLHSSQSRVMVHLHSTAADVTRLCQAPSLKAQARQKSQERARSEEREDEEEEAARARARQVCVVCVGDLADSMVAAAVRAEQTCDSHNNSHKDNHKTVRARDNEEAVH